MSVYETPRITDEPKMLKSDDVTRGRCDDAAAYNVSRFTVAAGETRRIASSCKYYFALAENFA